MRQEKIYERELDTHGGKFKSLTSTVKSLTSTVENKLSPVNILFSP